MERFGAQGAAAAIESRLEEAGAGSRPETIEQHAARLLREQQEDREREVFLATNGRALAKQEALALLDHLEKLTSAIGAIPERVDDRCQGCFAAGGFTICSGWYPGPYANVMDDGRLALTLWEGRLRLHPLVHYFKKPEVIREVAYTFDVARSTHQALWRPERGQEPPLSTRALAEAATKLLLDQIEKTRENKSRF